MTKRWVDIDDSVAVEAFLIQCESYPNPDCDQRLLASLVRKLQQHIRKLEVELWGKGQ